MAKRKKKSKNTKRRVKRRSGLIIAKAGKRRKRKASARKGFTMDTAGKLALTSMGLRLVQGTAFYVARRQGITTPKVRIFVPAAVWFASAQGYLPYMDGMTAMAADQTVNAVIDTTQTLRDIFDLRFLDKGVQKTAGIESMTPRSFLETSRQINEPMSGYERAGYDRAGYSRK